MPPMENLDDSGPSCPKSTSRGSIGSANGRERSADAPQQTVAREQGIQPEVEEEEPNISSKPRGLTSVQVWDHPLSNGVKSGRQGRATEQSTSGTIANTTLALGLTQSQEGADADERQSRPDAVRASNLNENDQPLANLREALQQSLSAAQRQQRNPARLAPNLAPAQQPGQQVNEAFMVRRNMMVNAWDGFALLSKWRKWVLLLRLLIGLAQVAAGIAVLALPTSLGDSVSTPETCDPEGMFVFLALHSVRVLASIPVDFYLGLSPHRSTRARRPGAEGLIDRERNRRIGSLARDRKVGRISDLMGFCHVVLFIVGNYVVWTSVECGNRPAESRPLFFTCVAMLCITYFIIFEVALMIFLVIFFLPLLIAVMSALGLSHRLPHRQLHPETDKISQEDIEKHSKLVYFVPAEQDAERGDRAQPPEHEAESDDAIAALAAQLPLPSSSQAKHEEGCLDGHPQAQDQANRPLKDSRTPRGERSMSQRFLHVFGFGRRAQASTGSLAGSSTGRHEDSGQEETLRYPRHPIPAHRATCPICLCEYEEPGHSSPTAAPSGSPSKVGDANGDPQITDAPKTAEEEPEPLRLLGCGHTMHKTCVDQWLTTVSGRCPVCQRPLLDDGKGSALPVGDDANQAA